MSLRFETPDGFRGRRPDAPAEVQVSEHVRENWRLLHEWVGPGTPTRKPFEPDERADSGAKVRKR